MKKQLLTLFLTFFLGTVVFAQLPAGGQWGCPSIPIYGEFDTTCFQRASELKLGQGVFDHYGSSDKVYLVIPQNRPSYAIAIAIAWDYYRNVLGRDGMSINQWFATMGQENGFASYNGVQLPATIYDVEVGGNVTIPCTYPRGCTSNSCSTAGYCWHVSQNGQDGPYHNTLAGYQTISPYVPNRYPGPGSTYHPLFNSNMEMASMNKTFYDLSIYRRAQLMNNVDLATVEQSSPDPYGVEAAQALAYNLGPNASQAISLPGYTLPAGIATNNNWSANYYSGGVSCYAQRVANITAVLDNNEAYAVSHYPGACGGTVSTWDFYSFYDNQIKWDTVLLSINHLLIMYPEINNVPVAKAAYIAAVKKAFDKVDSDANGSISYRYEMGGVIDAIVMNLPKDDPGFNAQYAINGTGCKLDCRAPYTRIQPLGPTTICSGQTVILQADVDSPTPSTTYQWLRNGAVISGATGSTYNATLAGTYSIIVCWSTFKESNGAATICCAQPECQVTVTVQGVCSSCSMGLSLTPTANSCTGMANGSISAVVSGATGPYTYVISGPAPASATTTTNSAATTFSFTGLRDGKYTITVRQQSDPTCKAVQDMFIVPTTVIKESLTATQVPASCNTQLNAVLTNQKPNSCDLTVSYGALGGYSWDRSFFMDLKANSVSQLTMFESYPSAGLRDDPWDYWPFSWPSGGPSVAPLPNGAPNAKTISVKDGDTINVFGITLVPLGTGVPTFIDGGVRLDGATFTNISTSATSAFTTFRYQGAAPVNGTRQMGATYIVTCPVVSPPAYTYSWSPTTGLSNASIKNPTAAIASAVTYTVTATHPGNTSCKLTASITVAGNCVSLPVELIDFQVAAQAHSALISWTTSNESNCKTYYIERSKDGIQFETIGIVDCHNNPSVQEYQYTDTHPYSGVSYYRLKEMDFDGELYYSEIRNVNFDQVLVHIQPNPFGTDTKVTIEGTAQDAVRISVTDMTGKILTEQLLTSEKSISLGSDYSNGVYVLQVNYRNMIKNYKIVKQ